MISANSATKQATDLQKKLTALESKVSQLELNLAANGVWQDATPTLSQSVNVTFSGNNSRWMRIGKTITYECLLLITSAGTALAAIELVLPSTVPSASQGIAGFNCKGSFIYFDPGLALRAGSVYMSASRSLRFICDGTTSFMGIDPNFATANTDQLAVSITYETTE